MLTTGDPYRGQGGNYFTRLDPDKQTRRRSPGSNPRTPRTHTLQEAAA